MLCSIYQSTLSIVIHAQTAYVYVGQLITFRSVYTNFLNKTKSLSRCKICLHRYRMQLSVSSLDVMQSINMHYSLVISSV